MIPIANRHDLIHGWFELTYAQYLAIPRTVLQSMPEEWQEKFVALLEELDETFDWRRSGCWVKFKDVSGRFIEDELGDYERGRRILSAQEIADYTERHNERQRQRKARARGKQNMARWR